MSGSQAGGRAWWAASGRPAAVLAAFVAVILFAPRPAAAHAVGCPELWNPHGQTTPPAGYTTAPGLNPNSGQNPDGFFQVIACSVPGTLVCPTGLGGPEFAAECFCDTSINPNTVEEAVLLFDAGDGCAAPRSQWYQYSVNGDFTFGPDPIVVKYTEANGKTQGIEPMAGNNSPNGDNQAMAVDWHLWGQGDLMVCSAVDPNSCTCCRVPPPPR
jgi:hypothetical protein